MKQEIENKTDLLKKKEGKILDLVSQITDLKSKFEQFSNQKVNNDFEKLVDELASKNCVLEDLHLKLKENEHDFEIRLKQNSDKIDQISTEYDTYKADKNHQIELLQTEFLSFKQESQLIQQHKDTQLKELTRHVEDLNEQSSSLLASREKEFQDLNSKCKSLEEIKQDLVAQNSNLLSEIESVKSISFNWETKLTNLKKEFQDLVSQTKEKETCIKALETNLLSLNKENDILKVNQNKYEQELSDYKLQNEKLICEIQENNKYNQRDMFFLSNNEENYLTEQIESLNSKLNSIDEIRQQIERR